MALVLIGSLLIKLSLPLLATGFASAMQARHIGLFPSLESWLALPPWLVCTLGVLLLELAIYWQHRLFHALPLLFRLHRVHHSDMAFDVSLGVRFHPLELMLSMLIKFAVIAALGLPPLSVLIFEAVLSASALWTHTSLQLPARIEPWVRLLFVTPTLHRVHHSSDVGDSNHNFGFCLSIWDRLFGSMRLRPQIGWNNIEIGLKEFRGPIAQTLLALLLNPFRKNTTEAAITKS
jgi:sterol desaturase/sphingolipid hydroxylase (fatty acid hydroxylase superfamily)